MRSYLLWSTTSGSSSRKKRGIQPSMFSKWFSVGTCNLLPKSCSQTHLSLTSIHANCFFIVHDISLRHYEIHLNCTIATSCNQILLTEWKIQTVYSHHISKIYLYWPMYASITDHRITENKYKFIYKFEHFKLNLYNISKYSVKVKEFISF